MFAASFASVRLKDAIRPGVAPSSLTKNSSVHAARFASSTPKPSIHALGYVEPDFKSTKRRLRYESAMGRESVALANRYEPGTSADTSAYSGP